MGELDGGLAGDVGDEEVEEDVVAVVGSVHPLGEERVGVVRVEVMIVPVDRQCGCR